MGVRFALAGGREGWVRALLTGVGVGLGVALLLLCAALPGVLTERDRREEARLDWPFITEVIPKADDTLIVSRVDTEFRNQDIRGRLTEPEGPKAPLPPGLNGFPAPGETVVSPALKELLASDGTGLLRERLPYEVVGTIGEPGLIGSQELAYYAGATGLAGKLADQGPTRLDRFGSPPGYVTEEENDPVLMLLILVVFVVLLTPVAVFIATAVRFGGERRDRRLAALRLVGSDAASTRRIAAGEALAGSLFGLVLGTGFFLVGRQVAASVELFGISVFPSYLNPSPLLALLVAVLVPAAAVLVTLVALRAVVIEPLGVVRTTRPARRRLWWRLLLPVAGLGMLYPMAGQGQEGGNFNQYLVVGGVLCLLIGITALLPWVVETAVVRLVGCSLSWQLAVRRLQLSSGAAARMVNGIAVAVAGAIALQMLFAGVEGGYTEDTGLDVSRAQMSVELPRGSSLPTAAEKVADTKGVSEVYAVSHGYSADKPWEQEPDGSAALTIADCATLRTVAALPSCSDGDVFAVSGAGYDEGTQALNKPGRQLYLEVIDRAAPSGRGEDVVWTVPEGVKQSRSVPDPVGTERGGFLLTPGAVTAGMTDAFSGELYLALDDSVPHAEEHVRNTAAAIDPLTNTFMWASTERTEKYDTVRTGLFVGAACVLLLIGASLLVSQLEQLRERRKLLSALVAFGTRKRTLSLSVLWQTAVPIGLGLVLASAVGVTLGAVLLRMTSTPVRMDWPGLLQMTGVGAAVVLVVTLLSLPPLLRMMRPDGLRAE
ncbi:ABC transporter permease [Streptomyces sp. KMM 9044]|uniref:ABC transporter permease n=1 Tax=Streptomyces sp. KMM 9044 TaxID=2744474 RepID=UPI002150DC00|nr:FtsX-like permease family protein [Streptomyces sp. KMM 9044]WAX81851.1 ABC transporter permease [Streptomyces sp. KMM 9044]